MLTKDQLRDGRALLRWTAQELSARVGMRYETILKLEKGVLDLEKTSLGNVRKLRTALEEGGIEFLDDGSVRRRPDFKPD